VTEHDVVVGYRLRLFTLAGNLGNVSRACRLMASPRSTDYRLEKWVQGLEALNVCERRRRGCPIRSGRTSSSGSWPSRWLARRLAPADQRRAGQGEVGWAADVRARRPARAGQVGAEHGRQRLALVALHRDPHARVPRPAPLHEKDHLENGTHDRVCDDARALRWLERSAAKDGVASTTTSRRSADTVGSAEAVVAAASCTALRQGRTRRLLPWGER
jgi:hypothetical protein